MPRVGRLVRLQTAKENIGKALSLAERVAIREWFAKALIVASPGSSRAARLDAAREAEGNGLADEARLPLVVVNSFRRSPTAISCANRFEANLVQRRGTDSRPKDICRVCRLDGVAAWRSTAVMLARRMSFATNYDPLPRKKTQGHFALVSSSRDSHALEQGPRRCPLNSPRLSSSYGLFRQPCKSLQSLSHFVNTNIASLRRRSPKIKFELGEAKQTRRLTLVHQKAKRVLSKIQKASMCYHFQVRYHSLLTALSAQYKHYNINSNINVQIGSTKLRVAGGLLRKTSTKVEGQFCAAGHVLRAEYIMSMC